MVENYFITTPKITLKDSKGNTISDSLASLIGYTGGFICEKTIPQIKQIIFNNPATIIYWKDGSKTVVKTSKEEFDEEKGFAMAYLKKIFGGRNQYLKVIEKAQRPQENKEIK